MNFQREIRRRKIVVLARREEEVVCAALCGGSTLWIIAVMGSSAVSSFRELTGRPESCYLSAGWTAKEGKVGLRIWSLDCFCFISCLLCPRALKSAVL